MLLPNRTPLHKLFNSSILMGTKGFLKPSPPFTFIPLLSPHPHPHTHLFHRNILIFSSSPNPSSKIVHLAVKSSGFSYTPNGSVRGIVSEVNMENPEDTMLDSAKLRALMRKLQEIGFDKVSCKPGNYYGLLCPMCKGGESKEKKLSLFITQDGASASWTCFGSKCGWRGNTRAFTDGKSTIQVTKSNPQVEITEKSLRLEPLCSQLLEYFAERMISGETLRRNFVMQRTYGDQIVIAFTYRRNGVLVNCKYRDINKKFWQEKGSEKIFYGLDDIKGSTDIIIVEGEMDKLSMEEAGYRNCISVPDGAPPSVSVKDLPPEEQLGHEVSIHLELQGLPEEGHSYYTCH